MKRARKARRIVYEPPDDALHRPSRLPIASSNASMATTVAVAVRSSATAEDLPDASFAGQHESYLNVRGADDAARGVPALLRFVFTDRAIVYRSTTASTISRSRCRSGS